MDRTMTRYIYDPQGEGLLRTEEAEPECGKDFCDNCGDCLYCYGDEECTCSNNGKHHWAEYEDSY